MYHLDCCFLGWSFFTWWKHAVFKPSSKGLYGQEERWYWRHGLTCRPAQSRAGKTRLQRTVKDSDISLLRGSLRTSSHPVHLAHKPKCTCPKDTSCYRYNELCQSTSQDEDEPRSDNELHQRSGQHAHQDAESPGTSGGGAGLHISTNDMLQFLVHPDVIALVTRLIMCRQRELHS